MRCLWLGHSQIPKDDIEINGEKAELERVNGATIDNAHEAPISDAIETDPDVIVVWLGGNDLDNGRSPQEVVTDLINVVRYCQQHTQAVLVCNIEPRNYFNEDRATSYNNKARTTNRLLTKLSAKHRYRVINVSDPALIVDSCDGIHFSNVAMRRVIKKIERAVDHAINDGTVEDYN